MNNCEDKIIELVNNQELSRYIKELNEDVHLTIGNLREKSLMCSSIWAKWLSYLYHEKENADRIVETKQKILKKKFAEKTGIQDTVLRMKAEEKIAENDVNIQKLNKLSKLTQDNIDYIERALNILSSFGFNIKNTAEIIKLNMTH